MSQYFVFVKEGEIRDFDDIYEGMVPEVIATADDLKAILSKELNISEWAEFESKKLIGKNTSENTEVTIDAIGKNNSRMITATGISQSKANHLASKLGLCELE